MTLKEDTHFFLLKKNGGLSSAAENIHKFREAIEGFHEATATFSLRDIDGVDSRVLNENSDFIEFLGSWHIPDHFSQTQNRKFINPRYFHKNHYSDQMVKCPCGAKMVLMENQNKDMQNAHNHSEDCKPEHRKEAKEILREKKLATFFRCRNLGWSYGEIAPRLGFSSKSSLKDFIDNSQIEITHNKSEEYKRLASNTYSHIVHNIGLDSKTAAELYGHSPQTLSRWFSQHGDAKYRSMRMARQDGNKVWVSANV